MKIWQRILLFFLVYALVVVLPWYLSVILLIGLTIYIPFYLEVLFFGFLIDTFYSVNYGDFFSRTFLIAATIILLGVMFIKTKIRV